VVEAETDLAVNNLLNFQNLVSDASPLGLDQIELEAAAAH
jgi:hypothetical protein